ncbi:hypothetical protein WR25_04514 [Diploscapter pachys]|uniref:SXP/RAL-2 family protein Ani s 5-like cation-binding domain-containing protein n=1 Tax=Diploscapter pachys TaxID=2018661 RepID=A0A2A2LG35_9BILA|nr:hypothetical protein WR25_04514 [Diploscapter pachys]
MKQLLLLGIFLIVAVSARKNNKHHPRCGLPPFAENLSDDIKEKLGKIWENYEVGTDCKEQRDATQQIVDNLTPEQKIRALRPIHHEPKHHLGHGHHGPKFLRNTTKEVRHQFYSLWKNQTLTRDEKTKAFDELANKTLDADQLEEYKKFAEEIKKRQAEFQKRVDQLSPEARGAYEKLNELKNQKARIFTDLSDSAKEELHQLWNGNRRWAKRKFVRKHKKF